MKKILDVCCSGREFWFDRSNPNALFCDIRSGEIPLSDGRSVVITPDVICDFTELPFPDDSFSLVVYDPPHLTSIGTNSRMAKKYIKLMPDWRDTIKGGFDECFRVLKPDGVLIFKWNEYDIPIKDVIALSPIRPLFGHRSGKQAKTHWMCFMKIASHNNQPAANHE